MSIPTYPTFDEGGTQTNPSAAELNVLIAQVNESAAVTAGIDDRIPFNVQQDLAGAGEVSLTTYYTAWTPGGAVAGTLANATVIGQQKKIQSLDANTGTLTFNTTATIVFDDIGDYALLMWGGQAWAPLELGNAADGATAPVYTPAS